MIRVNLLLFLPPAVYTAAYAYLAVYHGRINLAHTVIHESGALTFLETAFYASHFLGHIPVHMTAALLLSGWYLSFAGTRRPADGTSKIRRLIFMLAAFVVISLAFSLLHFGPADTFAYILQRKQGVDNLVVGGSWNLHLASTTMLFVFIPFYVYVVRRLAGLPVSRSPVDLRFILGAALLTIIMTVISNGTLMQPFMTAWSDPRYLAHSVRELATFPLIYFPIPLYFLFRSERSVADASSGGEKKTATAKPIAVAAVFFAAGLIYQAVIPLQVGIGDLAQTPDFAKNGRLGIAYLLSSHYFEHFLDTIFFTLLALIMVSAKRRTKIPG